MDGAWKRSSGGRRMSCSRPFFRSRSGRSRIDCWNRASGRGNCGISSKTAVSATFLVIGIFTGMNMAIPWRSWKRTTTLSRFPSIAIPRFPLCNGVITGLSGGRSSAGVRKGSTGNQKEIDRESGMIKESSTGLFLRAGPQKRDSRYNRSCRPNRINPFSDPATGSGGVSNDRRDRGC